MVFKDNQSNQEQHPVATATVSGSSSANDNSSMAVAEAYPVPSHQEGEDGYIHVQAVPVPTNTDPQQSPSDTGGHPPASTTSATPPAETESSSTMNEPALRTLLSNHHWPKGLQDNFIRNLDKIPYRFFICDDSGSMSTSDGHRIVASGQTTKYVTCTRWKELTTALTFHADVARLANATTEFRFLNLTSTPIIIGDPTNPDGSEKNYQTLLRMFYDSPSGGTPLCHHIRQVITKITQMAPTLRARGQKACVMIATDGESSDGDIAAAMQPLKSLPCWVVVRLCTDQDSIVEYWNGVDSVLELDMDVLDDLKGEAEEVEEQNPWLTYAEPLHRIREFGIPLKELDLLDESKLTLDQFANFVSFL